MKNISISLKNLKKKIIIALSKYIKKGSIINCEFDLSRFYSIALATKNKSQYINFFIDILLELIGKKGTLIIPGFSYSWGANKKRKIFDLKKTKPQVGILPNFILKNRKDALRTNDPMFSFFILGNNKKFFSNISNNSFGKNSIYHKILKKKGILISFGLNRFDPTFVHYVEQYFDEHYSKLGYRYLKKFSGHIVENKKIKKSFFYTFARLENSKFIFNEKNIKKKLINAKKLKKLKILNNKIYIVNSKDFFDVGIKNLKINKNFFIKNDDT